ncbi:MAG: helix-turn-helix domain-containing protein [Bacteroidales bacterium]
MLEANNSATIETIALDCGFNSSRNFHRLFREKFGMTPTEFRKLAHLEN